MTTNIINGRLNHGIIPGEGNYGLDLTVTAQGQINASKYGIYAPAFLANAAVLNQGLIHGGDVGIDLLNYGTVTNTGNIYGGAAAIVLEFSGFLNNSGTISGGDVNSGAANAAIYLGYANLTANEIDTVINSGLITGKDVGLDIQYADLANSGRIYGGLAGTTMLRGSILNAGTISGKTLGATMDGGSLDNAGLISSPTIALLALAGNILNESGGSILGNILGVGLVPTSVTALTFTNDGIVNGGTAGIYLTASSLINFGTVARDQIGVYLASGYVKNAGLINGSSLGITQQAGYAINSGTIAGNTLGAYIYSGKLLNTGSIIGGDTGVTLQGGVLANAGSIRGAIGVQANGGVIATAGAISGEQYAIYGKNAFTVNITPGASFTGAVRDASGNGTINLVEGAPASLSGLGTSISGFSTINFLSSNSGDPGAWTLSGDLAALASGQIISGFNQGNILVLTNFQAVSGAYTLGSGLVLSNGADLETLNIELTSGNYVPYASVYGQQGKTYIISNPEHQRLNFTPSAGAISVIANAVAASVTPGEGNYAGNLTITTTGTLNASNGVPLTEPNNVTNATVVNDGLIEGSAKSAAVSALAINLANFGTIIGGVYSRDGSLTNQGVINGSAYVFRVTNSGVMINQSPPGQAVLTAYGDFSSNSTISGAGYGVFLGAFATDTLQNAGTILGGRAGVSVANAVATLTNTGIISGGLVGIQTEAGAVIINSGTIAGSSYAIGGGGVFGAGPLILVATPGAVFQGAVHADYNRGELDLASGNGSLDIGNSFSGFPTISFAPGASWTLKGDASGLSTGQAISGFAPGDTIVLENFAAAASYFRPGTGLVLTNGPAGQILDFTSLPENTLFQTTVQDGETTIALQPSVACFCRGTRIQTPSGNIAIEKLHIRDLVTTLHGDKPIRWIGRRAYDNRFIANNPDILPIRIRRHAIAFNIPSRDLYVSPDHAICESGVLIHAHLLQNGISIHQPDTKEDVEYFHLEFDTHTILFAEHLSTESFIDEGAKDRFQNSHTRPAGPSPQKSYLPRVFEGFHLHNIKSKIAARAGIHAPTTLGPLRGVIDECTPTLIRGWAQNSAAPEHPVTLEIISGAYRRTILANAFRPDLRAAGLGSGCHGFQLTLPYLQHPVRIRRIPDGAILPPPTTSCPRKLTSTPSIKQASSRFFEKKLRKKLPH